MIETRFSPTNAVIDNQESILMDILNKGKNIAIYERNIDSLETEITQLMKDSFEYRASGTPKEICGSLESDFSSFFSSPSQLLKDVKNCIDQFNKVTKSATFNLLLATINTNMCRRFHTDMNDLRMLCTYSGPGTLWLPEDNVNREALYASKDNHCIVRDNNNIQRASTGSIIILKGAIYPEPETKAIVHRSPTIEEIGERRLLLRIDTNDFLGLLTT